jgi:predicted transcriptional regulator of viral defense system
MKFIRQPYYVGLLSAAAIHGAAHQQPQEFHVVIPEALRNIKVGSLQIKFFKKASMKRSLTEDSKTQTGYMKVSNPAVTAIDLVAYASRVGGLDRVLTVLQELSETITPDMLLQAAKRERNIAYVQRLGWLLARAGQNGLVEEIADWLNEQKPRETPLDPSLPRKGFSRDPKWKVIVNAEVKGEL